MVYEVGLETSEKFMKLRVANSRMTNHIASTYIT